MAKRRDKVKSPLVDIIIRARNNKKVSQEHLAAGIGMETNTYGHIETGQTRLTTDTMVKVCSFLGIEVHLILDREVLK